MRVLILRDPPPRVEGFDTAMYRQGQIYEVGRSLGDVLVRCKFAELTESPGDSPARPDTSDWPRRD